jgi:SAM-dependent methyltransferase
MPSCRDEINCVVLAQNTVHHTFNELESHSRWGAPITMSFVYSLLEQSLVYSLWQAPFAAEKLAPVLEHNDLRDVRRVLDVGCGPGTNTGYFSKQDYLGIDINSSYIETARKKHNRAFVAADLTSYADESAGKFDFILLNSFLHHLDDDDSHRLLSRLPVWLQPGGYLHFVELAMPGHRSVAQLLATLDRGKYVRPMESWRNLFQQHVDIILFEPYRIKLAGATLWNMVYCKGRARS